MPSTTSSKPKATAKKQKPTLFDILALSPKSLSSQPADTQTKLVKQAYRRALLTHHPDKQPQAAPSPSSPSSPPASKSGDTPSTRGKQETEQHYTIDQITHAYTVLSDARQRRQYTHSLSLSSTSTSTSTSTSSSNRKAPPCQQPQSSHHSTISLDQCAWDGVTGTYVSPCGRCGTVAGYRFSEADLDACESEGEGEILVECAGCSLRLRVLFEEVDEVGEGVDGVAGGKERGKTGHGAKGGQGVKGQKQKQKETEMDERGVEKQGEKTVEKKQEGQKGSWSWRLSFGFSLSGALGLGVGASAGSS